jgi:hypothetical protein
MRGGIGSFLLSFFLAVLSVKAVQNAKTVRAGDDGHNILIPLKDEFFSLAKNLFPKRGK